MRYTLGIAALAALFATPVSANCNPAKLAGTFNEQGYVYINMGAGITNAQTVGSFHAAGAAAANNNGTYGSHEWLFVDLNGLLSMQANLGDARVNGCPAGKLVTRIFTPGSNPVRFLTLTAIEGATGSSSAFDYRCTGCPNGHVYNAIPLPRPRVLNTSRAGNIVNVTWQFDSTTAGNPSGDPAGAVTGYELVRAVGSDPGRDPAAWTLVTSVTSDGSQTTTQAAVDCGVLADQYFSTRLLFQDGLKSPVVGTPTRINCNPALADPEFRIVPKRPTGPKKPAPAR